MSKINEITGQLLFRDRGSASSVKPNDDRQLWMVTGIIAVPNTEIVTSQLKGEHQYVVTGDQLIEDSIIRLNIFQGLNVDRTEISRGAYPGQLLCSPIWKI